jgi:hypothetical protein
MHQDQLGAELLGPSGEWGNQSWGYVRYLYARDEGHVHALCALPPEQEELAYYLAEIGGIYVVSYGQRTVVQDLGVAQQLAREQRTIAQE